MSTLSDIIALLDRWPTWKAITALPGRVAELEARIARLESGTITKKTGGVTIPCPICGEPMKLKSVKRHPTLGTVGMQERYFECECGHREDQLHDPTK